MWTTIKEENFDKYINQYRDLQEESDSFKLYTNNGRIILPRDFYKNYPSQHLEIINQKISEEPVNFKFTSSLRPGQQDVIDTIWPSYQQNGYVNGVIKLRPGAGKSALSIYLASQIGKKSLFIVDNATLMKQWIEEIINFTDLTIDDIGIIKQGFINMENPVLVGMVQTLFSRYKSDTGNLFNIIDKAKIGYVSFDEVHKSASSEKYSKVSTLFRTKNIIGLSATPYKYGTQEILMKNTIGDIIYDKTEYELKPIVKFVYYESKLGKKAFLVNKLPDLMKKKAIYNSLIHESKNYLNQILLRTKEALEEKHKVIIIAWTEKQVKAISEFLETNGIQNRQYYSKSRKHEKTDNVLVATYAYASHGFNFKELSAIILACPLTGKTSIIQCVGRILRECANKEEPVVYDLVDVSFPTLFLNEIKKKVGIYSNEFNCEFQSISDQTPER